MRSAIDPGQESMSAPKVGIYPYRLVERCSDVLAFEPAPLFAQMLEQAGRSRYQTNVGF